MDKILYLSICTIILTILSVPVSATTITVCPSGCDYNAIGLAIENAEKGDTIYVYNGTYKEHLNIEKPVTLIGLDYPVIDGSNKERVCLRISTENVTVEGLKFLNCYWPVMELWGRNNLLKNNHILVDQGYSKIGGRNNSLIGNKINNLILLTDGGSNHRIINNTLNGIDINDRGDHLIYNNTVCSGSGVKIRNSYDVKILNNTICNNSEYGVLIFGFTNTGSIGESSSNEVGGNTIYGNNIAVCLEGNSRENTIHHNRISRNNIGILMKKIGDERRVPKANIISNNNFSYNSEDIILGDSSFNRIVNNTLCNVTSTETNEILDNKCIPTTTSTTTSTTILMRDIPVETKQAEEPITETNTEEQGIVYPLEYTCIFWFGIISLGIILIWLGNKWKIRDDEIKYLNMWSIVNLLKFGLSASILLRCYTIASILLIVSFIGLCIGRLLFGDSSISDLILVSISGLILIILTLILVLPPLFFLARGKQKKLKKRKEEEEEKLREEEEKARKKREFEAKMEKLRSLDHDYIKNFVKKYHEEIYVHESAMKGYEAFKNLKKVLSRKGVDFSDSELEEIIKKELYNYEYDEFKHKILSRNPKDVEDYLRLFLEYYDEYYEDFDFELLKTLIKEEIGSVENLEQRMDEIKEEIKLERFEKTLTDSERRVTLQDIDSMSGYNFERFLEKLFKKMGYSVTHTKLTGDQGGDLIISKFGEKIAVQAKRSENLIGNRAVQEVLGAMKMYSCSKGMVVTNNEFTAQARELAVKSNVELVDRNKLRNWIREYM